MASAESGEEAAMEPVGGRANEENEHLSDNDEIAADGDIEDDKKGSTRVQKVNKQETRLQRVKNQDMFRSANKAVSGFRVLRVILVTIDIGFLWLMTGLDTRWRIRMEGEA